MEVFMFDELVVEVVVAMVCGAAPAAIGGALGYAVLMLPLALLGLGWQAAARWLRRPRVSPEMEARRANLAAYIEAYQARRGA